MRRTIDFCNGPETALVTTTVGKIIFNTPIPQDLGYVDRTDPEHKFDYEVDFQVTKKKLPDIISRCLTKHGTKTCAMMLDQIKIRQMLLNLLKNAWEAVPVPGGKKTVSACPKNPGISINIQDIGCGISPEHQATIFQPFFTTKESGTGLGLPIVKQIAEAHNGSISLESSPDHGTIFHIFLG